MEDTNNYQRNRRILKSKAIRLEKTTRNYRNRSQPFKINTSMKRLMQVTLAEKQRKRDEFIEIKKAKRVAIKLP